MPKNETPSQISSPASVTDVGTPSVVTLGVNEQFDLYKYRDSAEGKKTISWALEQFTKAKSAKTRKHSQWYLNMAFTFGHQWVTLTNSASEQLVGKIKPLTVPPYVNKRTVNRIRSFVRSEQSKFLSTLPVVTAVPSTAEEEDIRAAYASEQAWQHYASKSKLRREVSRAVWWMVITGTGILKTWWDPTVTDKYSGQPGDIAFRSVTPFHIFVADMREREIDDQPYIIQAQVKTLEWVKQFWAEELAYKELSPSTIATNTLMDDAYFNLTNTPKTELDSVVVLEVWVKPGTTPLLPKGGLLVIVEDCLVAAYIDGMPYRHNEYPYTKFEHLSNDSFFADSPIVDLIELQKEFNETRTQIGVNAKRMGNAQLLAQQGSIVPGRMTNEPGQQILYRPGTPPPSPLPLQPLPEYVTGQLDRIVTDFEDLSGQHDVSRGQAPPGVTAGTALAFLKETDDAYLTPQYQNIEDAYERIATQTLELFVEFVDSPRKIKVIGTDGAFDTALLSGADIAGGTDVRVEPGSSIGQSMAAKRAAVMDMFSIGILQDPNQALRLLEVGGAQKVLDTVSVAEKKAQRENTKIKSLAKPEGQQLIQQHYAQHLQEMLGTMAGELQQEQAMDPTAMANGEPPITPELIAQNPEIMQYLTSQVPPVIPADDFDMHAIHIDAHNRYRMGQEYETLPDPVKQEFDKHVTMHEMLLSQQFMQQQMMGFDPMTGGPGGEEGGEEQGQPPGGEDQGQADMMPPTPAQPPMA